MSFPWSRRAYVRAPTDLSISDEVPRIKQYARRILPSQLLQSPRLFGALVLSFLLGLAIFGHGLFKGRPRYTPEHFRARLPANVSAVMWESEQRYQRFLNDRQEYIERLGGLDKISSWPMNAEFYTLWDFFIPAFVCPYTVERVGSLGDGGKWICGMDVVAQKRDVVVYSFGIFTDSSFEAAVLERAPTAQVWGYDYSVSSFGPEIENNARLKHRAHFFDWAIGETDAHGADFDPHFQVYTLDSLMKLNGHTFIDILKIDIEEAEFEVLAALCDAHRRARRPLPFGQLQVEIHARGTHGGFRDVLGWWEKLEEAGLRPFHTEPNLVYVNVHHDKPNLAEYSFLNLDAMG